jgi:hypothetical protein
MKKKTSEAKTNELLEYSISKAFLGIFVFIYGLMFLIDNLNIYPINIDLANLWPLLIVFIGLSFFEKKNVTSTIVGSVVTIMCATLFFSAFSLSYIDNYNFSFKSNVVPIKIEKNIDAERAEIELNVSGGEVNIYGIDSNNLVDGKLVGGEMENSINQSTTNLNQKVIINLQGENKWTKRNNDLRDKFSLGINKNTPLNFVLNSGGSLNNIDLSEVMAEDIRILVGASNLSLKLGDIVDSDVIIEAGASFVKLDLPSNVGVKIMLESGLSSQELSGFSLVEGNVYQSENYDSKEKKININATIGMASLNINWYSSVTKNEVSLFYYNQIKDENKSCNVDFILPMKRYVASSDNQIKDTIDLLIKGELTEQEKKDGFITEFPNKDFKLLETNLSDDGVLILRFTEVPGFTTGGICRVKILGSEIIRTARQFPGVRKVVLEPETLFEP